MSIGYYLDLYARWQSQGWRELWAIAKAMLSAAGQKKSLLGEEKQGDKDESLGHGDKE